ncbi:KxYKxGKxW signal peptide domain-containing protein [Nostoc sp. PA-18-2419]
MQHIFNIKSGKIWLTAGVFT